MAKIGYIYRAEEDATFDESKDWMEEYGCIRILIEESKYEKLRPQWKNVLELLKRGDILVLSKFSNAVRTPLELSNLIELCRVMQIRLISINDKIDTDGTLFPKTTLTDVLYVLGSLPEEVVALREQKSHVAQIKRHALARKVKLNEKAERELLIVNMYQQGHSIDDIWAASGYASKCNLYYVLNKHGVTLNRGKFSGPRKKKETNVET